MAQQTGREAALQQSDGRNGKPPVDLVIDTDPGQDDALAIMMAFGLEKMGLAKVRAIHAVAGNVGLELTQRNARVVRDWVGRPDVPVRAGASRPLLKPLLTAEHVHGKTGLDGVELHEPRAALSPEHAVDALRELLLNAPERSVTVCAIGPLTNLGLAFATDPKIARGVKSVVVMGGCYFEPGNVSPNADFNFFVDPAAAQIVLNAGVDLKIIPLDVTHKVLSNALRIERLKSLPNENGPRAAAILSGFERYDADKFGLGGGPMHDPCAIAMCVAPEMFSGRRVHVGVETSPSQAEGASIVDWADTLGLEPNAFWANGADDEAFFELFTQAIAHLP